MQVRDREANRFLSAKWRTRMVKGIRIDVRFRKTGIAMARTRVGLIRENAGSENGGKPRHGTVAVAIFTRRKPFPVNPVEAFRRKVWYS